MKKGVVVKRVLLAIIFVLSVLNADYIKVGTYTKLENAKEDFLSIRGLAKNHTYIYKVKNMYEIRVEDLKAIKDIKLEHPTAYVVAGSARDDSFVEIATLKSIDSIDDMFKSLKNCKNLYVKSNRGFFEFRADVTDKSKSSTILANIKKVYKDAWYKNVYSSDRLDDVVTKLPKSEKKYRQVHNREIYVDTTKVYQANTPKNKNIYVNEPTIPANIVTIAKETNEVTGTRVSIKRGDRLLVSGKVVEDYDGQPLYYEK
jgi:hypothetical protein